MPVRRRAGERLPTVWDFETDPQYQSKLDWVEKFMAEELEPLDLVALDPYDKKNADTMAILRPLQRQVKDQGLWAAHLRPELGGQGFGQVKLALLNEIIGRSRWAPSAFGCQAPDSGNAEILALFGTDEQKARYLRPLLDGEITSCYSMTEPQGGSDPGLFVTAATRDAAGNGDWIINGEKWFSTNAKHASFFIVMAVTKPEARTYEKMSLFIVPADTPGIEIVRNVGVGAESTRHASHGYIRYHDVRVPADHVLGGEGQAFMIAQTRLGGGRIHHAMRTIALARRAFDMMCERALSRQTRHGRLADLQMTQEKIADSWIQIEQFRLLVLRTAWLIDKHHDYQKVRRDIAAVKVAMPQVLHDVVQRAMHLHGALGVSDEMPFVKMMLAAESLGIADGAALVEPTILLAVFALSIPAGSANLGALVASTIDHPGHVVSLAGVLAFVALVIVIVAETGRLPVDNPATHLELTMVHEAMVLEYAGPRLALVEWAAGMRLTVLLALLANLFLPWGIAGAAPTALDVLTGVVAVAAKVAILAVLLATFEVFLAKLRLFRVPELLAGSFLLALLAVTAANFFTVGA